jgi:hypothetical protein
MRANDHRVNRLARQALVKLGLRPAPNRLYALQLMDWALSGPVVRDDLDVESLREGVAILDMLPTNEAMAALALAEDAPGRPGLQARHLLDKSPREIALSLLWQLDGSLKQARPAPSFRITSTAA